MTVPANAQENQVQETKQDTREFNFRQQEQLFKRQLEEERQARLAAEKALEEQKNARRHPVDDDDDTSDDPYIDRRTLDKKLKKWEANIDEKIDRKAEEKARILVEQEKRNSYLRSKGDFNNVMSPEMMQKLVTKDPELAETILEMPEGFARQKLVYQTIKAMKLDQAEEKKPSIQEKVDANKRSPYYQPSGMGSAPYAAAGDYSPAGQKNAYAKLQELKNKLRL
jgi:hypothetical protein